MQLQVGFNRTISVDRVYLGGTHEENNHRTPTMARFSFDELCDTEKGAMDYRAIAQTFDIVIVEDIPTLDLEGHNRARRFITLIDELYEGKCALLCSALNGKTPMDLFQTYENTHTATNNNNDSNVVEGGEDDEESNDEVIFGIDVAQQGGTPVGALASVRELSFAFERASSRIYEMCSRSWWQRVLESSSVNLEK
jgi:predicted ATPase